MPLINRCGGGSAELQNKTVTPKASTQYVKPGTGYDGLSQVTVYGDSDLVGANVAKGANIFGVPGTAARGYVGEKNAGDHVSYIDFVFTGLNGRIPNYIVVYSTGIISNDETHVSNNCGDICTAIIDLWLQGGASPTGHKRIISEDLMEVESGEFSLSIPNSSNLDMLRVSSLWYGCFYGNYKCLAVY